MNDQSASAVESAQVDIAIDAASREIEEYCNRRFYLDSQATARVYSATQYSATFTDDIGDTSSLVVKTDENGDGTFETTWAATDYQTEPFNALVRGRPITLLRAIAARVFPIFEGAGAWLSIAGQNRSFFAPGAILAPGINRRNQALIQVTAKWGWPAIPIAIKQAALIQGAMLYQAKNAPAGLVGSVDLGAMRYPTGLHPQAKLLVEPYRWNAGGVV